jgi:hypothetical protein
MPCRRTAVQESWKSVAPHAVNQRGHLRKGGSCTEVDEGGGAGKEMGWRGLEIKARRLDSGNGFLIRAKRDTWKQKLATDCQGLESLSMGLCFVAMKGF